jgi:uncharacterized protein YbcI
MSERAYPDDGTNASRNEVNGAGEAPPRGGELNAAITSALVGIHHRYLGRGPTSASTWHHDNVIVTLMFGVLTPAEQSLAHSSHADAVAQMRAAFQEVMAKDFGEAVERVTGRELVEFVSGNNVETGVVSEVFIMDANV